MPIPRAQQRQRALVQSERVARSERRRVVGCKAGPDEATMALVPPKTFSAKHNKKKVKVTVDAAGLHVVEDNKQAADLGSYKLNKMKTWSVNGKKNSFELVMAGKKGKTLVFATKEAPGIDMAIQSATMAMAAWRAMQEDDGDANNKNAAKQSAAVADGAD